MAADSWRTVFSTWFPDGAKRGELHGKLVLEEQQTLQIPDTYLTLALGVPPTSAGKWAFSGRLSFGGRVSSIAGSFGPSGVCSVALPNLSIQDPGTPYLKGYKNVRMRRTLFLKLDRSVAGRSMVTASMTMTLGSKDTTLAPNPAVATGRLLPVTASYAFLPERVTFQFDGAESAGISGGVATGYLSAGRLLLAGVGAGYETFSAGIPTTVFEKTLSLEGGEGGALFARGVVSTAKPGVGIGAEVEFYRGGRIVGVHRKANWGSGVVARTVSIFSDDISRGLLGFGYTAPSAGVFRPFLTEAQSEAKVVFDELVTESGEVSAGGGGGLLRWRSSQLSILSSGADFVANGNAWKFDPQTGFFSGEHGVVGRKIPRKFAGVILQSGPLAAALIADDGRSGSAVIIGDTPEFLPGGELPAELTLLAGSSAGLQVNLSGGNLVYRWYKRSSDGGWLEVSTETTSRFQFTDVDWSDGGEYRVVVYNGADESLSEDERRILGKQCESTCHVRVLTANARPVLAWVRDAAGVERYVVVDVEIEAARPPAFTLALTVPQGMPAIRVPVVVDQTSGLLGALKFSMADGQLPGGTISLGGDLTLSGALFRDASDQPLAFRVNASEDVTLYNPPATASGRVEVKVVETPAEVVRRHVVRMGTGLIEVVWDDALGGVGGGTTLVDVPSYNGFVPGSPRVNGSGNLELDTDAVTQAGRYLLAVTLDWAGETTAALLEIEYVSPVGDRVLDFVVHRNLTAKSVGGTGAEMFWAVGLDAFPDGTVESGAVRRRRFDGAVGGLTTVNGSSTVTVASTAGLMDGMNITGAGIPSGTTVSAVTGPTTLTISQNANATIADKTLIYSSGALTYDALWKFALDTLPSGVVGTDLGATILPEGLVRVSKLPSEGVDTVDLFVLAESDEMVKRQLRGVIRFNVVRPAASVVDFTVYRGALGSRVNGLAGLSGVRSPVIVRNGGDLSRVLQLQWGGVVSVDSEALDAMMPTLTGGATTGASPIVTVASTANVVPGMQISGTNIATGARVVSVDSATQLTLSLPSSATGSALTFSATGLPALSRGVFEVLDAPVALTGRLVSGDRVVRDVGSTGVFETLLGSVVTGFGIPLGTKVEGVDASAKTLTLSSVAEVTGVVSMLAEPRTSYIAVDFKVADPGARLEWTIPSNSGRLRLNAAQVLRDAVPVGSGGHVADGTSVLAGLRLSDLRFSKAADGTGFTVTSDGMIELLDGAKWAGATSLACPLTVTLGDGSIARVEVLLKRAPEDFSLSATLAPRAAATMGFLDRIAERNAAVQLQRVSVRSVQASRASGGTGGPMTPWERLRDLGRVGETIASVFVPRATVFGSVYYSQPSGVLSLGASEGDVVFLQESQPKVVRAVSDADFADGVLKSTLAGPLLSVLGPVQVGDVVSLVDSAYPGWDGVYRVMNAGGPASVWSLAPLPSATQGFYQVLKRGSSPTGVGNPAWVMVRRQGAALISREVDASWVAGKLVANVPSVLSGDSGALEVGAAVVLAGQGNSSWDGVYSVADVGSAERPWVLVRHLAPDFAVPASRVSVNFSVTPDALPNLVVSGGDAENYREGDLARVTGALGEAVYRLADKTLYVFAKVSSGVSASAPPLFVDSAGVVSGIDRLKLPGGMADSFGVSAHVFVSSASMLQSLSGEVPSLKVGDGFRVTFNGGDGANDGAYRVVGVVSRWIKETESLSTTVDLSAGLGGSISGNLFEVASLPAGLSPRVGDRVYLPGVRDTRYAGTRAEAQGGVYVVLRQSDGAGVTWLMSREPSLTEMALSKVAGFSGLSYVEQGGVVAVSSGKVLVDGLSPISGEWLSDSERGVYELSQVNLAGADADSLVLSQVLGIRVDQGGAVDFRRWGMDGVTASVGVDLVCGVTGSVGGLNTVSGMKEIEVSSTDGLAVGMILSGLGVPSGARIEAILDGTRLKMGVVASASGVGGTLGYGYDMNGRIQLDLLPSNVANDEIQVNVLRGGQTLSVDLADYLGLYYGGEHRFEVLGALPSFVRGESLRQGRVSGARTTDGSAVVAVPSTGLLRVGMYVFGSAIPLGAKVSSILSETTFQMDLPATSSASGLEVSYVSTLLEMRSVPADWASNEEVLLYRLQSGGITSYGKVVLTIKDPAFSVGYVGVVGGDPEVVQISERADFLRYKEEHGLIDPVFFTLEPGAPSWMSVSSMGAVLFDCRALKEGVEQLSARVTFIDSRTDRTVESGIGEGYLVFEVKKPLNLSELLRLSAGQGSGFLALPSSMGLVAGVAPQVRLLGVSGGGVSMDGFGTLRITPSGAAAPLFAGLGIRMSSASGVIDDESTGDSYVYAGEPYVLIEATGPVRADWSYQWMKNGVPMAGANSAKLVMGLGVTEDQGIRVGGVTVHDEGMYSLVVSNSYGKSESAGLHLRVVERSFIVDPPSLGLDDAGLVIPIQRPTAAGSRTTLSVTAAGANRKQSQYLYRWYFRGADGVEVQIPYEDEGGESDGWLLNRATGWQLVVEDFSSREEGAYRVEVLLTDDDQVLDTERGWRERRWTLWSRPTITLQPRSTFGLSGEAVLFRIQVTPEIHPSLDVNVPAPYMAASQVRWFKRMSGEVTEVGFGDTLTLAGNRVSKAEMDEAVFYAEVTDPRDSNYKLLSREVRLRVYDRTMREGSENDGVAGYEMKPVTFDNGSSSYRMNVAITETTLGQWKAYVEDSSETWMANRQDATPTSRSSFWMKPGFNQDDTHPVVNVSWEEARDYCNWLSQRTGYRWRMMTSPEWSILTENKEYPWDGAWPPRAMSGNLSRAVPTADDGYLFTSPATLFNPLGDIFGLGGNVSEWLDEAYYEVRMPGGVRYERGFRAFVGPSWATRDKSVARTSYRGRAAVGYRDNRIGFRVVAENLDYRAVPLGTVVMGDDVTPVAARLGLEPVVELVSGSGSGAMGVANVSGADLLGVTVKNGGTGYAPGDLPVVTVRWRSLPEMPDHPAHRVKVPSVDIGETEVTWRDWNTVASWAVVNGYVFDSSPDAFGDLDPSATEYKDYHPVHSVTWWDAVKWCNARSEMEGLTPCYYIADGTVYRGAGRPKMLDPKTKRMVEDEMRDEYVKWGANGYRLPTEAEWEKAAREGTQGAPFAFGNRADFVTARAGADASTIIVSDERPFFDGALVFGDGIPAGTVVVGVIGNSVTLSKPVVMGVDVTVGVYRFGRVSPDFETQAVSGLPRSGYGLRGVLGNVREWCWDWYAGYDAKATASYRGTSWDSTARSAKYSLSPATGVASVAGGSIVSITMDTDIATSKTATVKVVVDGGHGYRTGDSVIFGTVLHPELNGTYEGITVVDESTFVFSLRNQTARTWVPITDSTDGTVTKLLSQRVYRGGGWDSISADDARVYGRDREPLISVASATVTALGASYTPGSGGGGVGATLVAIVPLRLMIDGQAPEVGDRVLVKNQGSAEFNGIYVVTDVGSDVSRYRLTRDSVFDENSELGDVNKQWVTVRAGTVNSRTVWKASVEVSPTIGISPISYTSRPGYVSSGLGFRVVKLQK